MKHKFGSYSAAMMLVSLVMLIIVMCSSLVMADTLAKVDIVPYPGFTINEYTLTMDSGGTGTTAIPYELAGEIICIETDPGTTAPTANYDMQLLDDNSIDVMGGALANRHTSTSERAYPIVNSVHITTGIPTEGALSVYRENNLVQDATVTLKIFVKNQQRNWR